MSDRPHVESRWFRSCLTKRRYRSPDAARRAAEGTAAQFRKPARYYPCSLCLGYHVTTATPTRRTPC